MCLFKSTHCFHPRVKPEDDDGESVHAMTIEKCRYVCCLIASALAARRAALQSASLAPRHCQWLPRRQFDPETS